MSRDYDINVEMSRIERHAVQRTAERMASQQLGEAFCEEPCASWPFCHCHAEEQAA